MSEKPYKKINLALYGDNYEYVQEMGYRTRTSATQYINKLILEDRERTGIPPLKKDNKK